VSALHRKLFRDLWRMRAQVITIALVVACGIASHVTVEGTRASLLSARDTYYERYRFPDVFVHLQRAPESVRRRIEALPGVALASTRVLDAVSIPLAGLREPASGYVISLPASSTPSLGAIYLRRGRQPLPGRDDEVVVLEAFAVAHSLAIGARVPLVLAGVKRELRVVGIALSPEFVFSVAPGEMMPDPKRFGVFWMNREVVAAACEMTGAFNDLLVRLQPGASERAVIERINHALQAYGGLGAYGRDRQLSNNTLRGELAQLQTMTRVMPLIFLGVAAFLINVVLSRLVQLQRTQIAVLRALGYGRVTVSLHYLQLVLVIVCLGALVGVPFGVWIGGMMTDLYNVYFHFMSLEYRLTPRVLVFGIGISALSALAGALSTVRMVIALPPAQAMQPEEPAHYRRGWLDRLGLAWLLGHTATLISRELSRRPLRTFLSALGIALGMAVLVAGRFGRDTTDYFMRIQFGLAQREDMTVVFRRAQAQAALRELDHLPGVLEVEGLRAVSVRYRFGARSRDSVLYGHPAQPRLRRVLDQHGHVMKLPKDGIVLTSTLGRILGIGVGDRLTIEVLEGQRRTYERSVAGFVDEVLGLAGHMDADQVAQLLGGEPRVSVGLLRVDPSQLTRLQRALRDRPEVLGVARREAMMREFQKQTAGQMRFTTWILTVFAVIIAAGVIYNNARIALSTRSRDLASLRVLGFWRSEISLILLGELALQVLLAIVPGMWLGRVIIERMMLSADPELYHFPAVVSLRTYAFAITVTLVAAVGSALVVRNRLDHLDLIGVLKSKD
jgi:putative ABC transport system permease protein